MEGRRTVRTMVAGVTLAAAAALATTGAASGASPTAQTGDVCTVAAGTGDQRCFDTLSEALESITGEPVTDPRVDAGDHAAIDRTIEAQNAKVLAASTDALASSAPSLSAASSLTAVASTGASNVLGALWKDKDWSGSAKLLYAATGSGCYGGTTYGFPHTSAFSMNDNISSLTTYLNCATTLYKDASYKGTSKTYQVDTSYVGDTMNDEASSIVYRPRS